MVIYILDYANKLQTRGICWKPIKLNNIVHPGYAVLISALKTEGGEGGRERERECACSCKNKARDQSDPLLEGIHPTFKQGLFLILLVRVIY